MQVVTNPAQATLTLIINVEEARLIIAQMSEHPALRFELEQAMSAMHREMKHTPADAVRCPGSGELGHTNGGLLICTVCSRVIGAWPPMTLPEHQAPIFDDGKEVRPI